MPKYMHRQYSLLVVSMSVVRKFFWVVLRSHCTKKGIEQYAATTEQ